MTLSPMLLPNLNVFFTCFILLAMYGAGPLMILLSLAIFPFVGPRASSNSYLILVSYLLLSLPLLAFWWKKGLAPARRIPERERRYRIGHWLLALANIATIVSFALPYALAQLSGNQNLSMLAWFALPIIAFVFLVWPLGLFMIWSSRASPVV